MTTTNRSLMGTAPRRTSPARRAFTLTEMLVVIAIIVLLVSILLPAVSSARNAARRTATESFMNSIQTAINQFRAAEQRMPGYFTVKDVGSKENAVVPGSSGIVGLTYLENALLDLGGGVYEDQTATRDDPSDNPDVILVGVDKTDPSKRVLVQRTAIGAKGGPGYLDIPEGYVDMGAQDSGRAGNNPGHEWMPRLVDAWGTPILMWPRDEFAGETEEIALSDSSLGRAQFYWAGNSGFTNAQRLGRRVQRSEYESSTLSTKVSGAANNEARARTLAAIVGNPAFPEAASLDDAAEGPMPGEARGDVILESAGRDGIYLESKNGQFDQYHYVPDGYFDNGNPAWTPEDKTNFLDKSDDVILSGS